MNTTQLRHHRQLGPFQVSPLDPAAIAAADQIGWFQDVHSGTAAKWWDDKFALGDLGQGTPANQPPVIDPDPAFNDAPTQNPDGVSDVLIATAGTEAVYKAMHDYSGFLGACAWSAPGTSADETLWATCSSSAQIGFQARWDSVAEAMHLEVDNGVTSIFSITTAAGSVPKNQKNRIVLWLKDGLAPGNEWEVWNSPGTSGRVCIARGTLTGAPSAANPTSRLVTFRNPASGTRFHAGKWPLLLLIKNVSVVQAALSMLEVNYP